MASPDYLMPVECEAAVVGSRDRALSPLYEASVKLWQSL